MLPGETYHCPRGVRPMTLVVIAKGEERVLSDVDPRWNVLVHEKHGPGGWTVMDKLCAREIISHAPGQPEDARFVVRKMEKTRGGMATLLVLTPEGEPESKIIGETFQWPRPTPMSVWERLRKPQV
jgi:hypothetical protein